MFALTKKDNRQQNDTIYNVGIYCRLSKEDESTTNESESISNQKEYLTRYIKEQGWNLVDVFVDDGYTGTNFNRPDFQRLLGSIETRQVNLVITKDLSRLGRDYIDTGHYVERYFPEHNVRYIALNDGIDTFENNNSNNDMSPFKSVMNDFYARDISKKVRTTMNTKRRNGQFIGAFAPYGYLKSPLDKNKLVVDPETAPVVKRIFEMYLVGSGYAHIAHTLNDEGVLCPSAHKALKTKYKNGKVLVGLWTTATVKSIIINPTYAGDLSQHKYGTTSYKVKKLKTLPRASWVIVKDTHEAIVDKTTFDLANQLTTVKALGSTTSPHVGHLLGGLLYCKDCGARMTFTKTQKGEWYCICSNYKRFKICTRHSYLEKDLQQYILEDLRRITTSSEVNQEELLQEAQEAGKVKRVDNTTKDIEVSEKRLVEIKRIIKTLYEDKLKGVLTEEDFQDLSKEYHRERDALTVKLSRISRPQNTQQEAAMDLLKAVRDLVEFNNTSKLIITKLIQRIEIAENKKITIYYQFVVSP